jgi:hypothetical protein
MDHLPKPMVVVKMTLVVYVGLPSTTWFQEEGDPLWVCGDEKWLGRGSWDQDQLVSAADQDVSRRQKEGRGRRTLEGGRMTSLNG